MATAKQLANLKKGREALAKKRASGKVKKSSTRKTIKKVAKTRETYLIKITTANKKIGYVRDGDSLDTDIKKAKKFGKVTGEKVATEFFELYKKYLAKVELIKSPK